ncbi:hypothetical protein V1478_009988, partial [Vespula squamosa]
MKFVGALGPSRRRSSSSTVAGETSKNALFERYAAGYSCEEEGAEPQATLRVARFDGTRADASNYSPIFAAAAQSSAFKHREWLVDQSLTIRTIVPRLPQICSTLTFGFQREVEDENQREWKEDDIEFVPNRIRVVSVYRRKRNYGEFARKAEDLWTMGVADRARCLNIWNDPDGWVTPRKTCGESVTKRSTAGGLQMPGDYG